MYVILDLSLNSGQVLQTITGGQTPRRIRQPFFRRLERSDILDEGSHHHQLENLLVTGYCSLDANC